MSDWYFDPLPRHHYRVIYMDPPPRFCSGKSRNPENHYRTMTMRQIAALPVKELAHPEGCRLLVWTTAPTLLLPFGPREWLKAWGFRYSTMLIWRKMYPRDDSLFQHWNDQARGTGYEVTGDWEGLIIAKRGKVESIKGRPFRGLYSARRREHSRKPDLIRDEIARKLQGPRCELFTRQTFDGWDAWGNEATKFNEVAK